MKRSLLLFCLMFSLTHSSFSQGEFLQRDQSNFGGGAAFSTNSEAQGWRFFAGYSYRAFLDASLSYAKANGGKIQGAVITPRITYYPLKQEDSKGTPTVALSLGYSAYTSRETTTYNVRDTVVLSDYHTYSIVEDQNISALQIGVSAHRRTGYWKALFFQPVLGADLLIKSYGWEFTLRGGVAIGTRIVSGPILIFTPTIERYSGITTFVFNLGTVF